MFIVCYKLIVNLINIANYGNDDYKTGKSSVSAAT